MEKKDELREGLAKVLRDADDKKSTYHTLADAALEYIRAHSPEAVEVERLREWIRFAPHRGDCAGRGYIGAVRQSQKCDCGHAELTKETSHDPD